LPCLEIREIFPAALDGLEEFSKFLGQPTIGGKEEIFSAGRERIGSLGFAFSFLALPPTPTC
jgi:hypothetical protein